MICPFVFDEPEKVAAQDESVATERRIARAIANKRFNPVSSFRSFFFFNYTRDQLSFQLTTAPKTEYGRITKNAAPETVQKDGTIRVRCPQTRSKKAPKFLVTAPFSATREARFCRIAFLSDLQDTMLRKWHFMQTKFVFLAISPAMVHPSDAICRASAARDGTCISCRNGV